MTLPTPFSARIARNTQLILAEETGIPHVIDPLGGSYYVESLTASMAREAEKLIDEVEALGGMTRAIEAGMPKLRIEEAATRRQARIDRGEDVVVGVNKYPSPEPTEVELLDIDNTEVREKQVARLKQIRATRDEAKCAAALAALEAGARGADANLLELAIECARARASVGEISLAMEKVYGRHRAETRSVSGVYAAAYRGDPEFEALQREIRAFADDEGRRPRILVAKLGQDGHDRGAKVIATSFADLGFDVDVGPLFQTPEEVARQAIENDVHVVGVSTQAGGHKTLVPAADRGAAQPGRRRRRGDLRRRDPAPGLRVPARARRGERVRSGHPDPARRARGASLDPRPARMTAALSPADYVAGVRAGDRRVIAKAITLLESRKLEHRELGQEVLDQLMPATGGAVRVGITGPPGVGKSSFIETLGMSLVASGQSLAVLAIDPSSPVSGGSILGDKTRMERLAREPKAYIRPTPSGGTLGGVAHRTREAILICEAAGFDVVIVETVGVGQSEVEVRSMVDLFAVLLQPGAGDELQGLKKGVLELADALVVNKADGEQRLAAERARADYAHALSILQPASAAWTPVVLCASARTGEGVDEFWRTVLAHREAVQRSGDLERRRRSQARAWLWRLLDEGLQAAFKADPKLAARLPELEAEVEAHAVSAPRAARTLLDIFTRRRGSR